MTPGLVQRHHDYVLGPTQDSRLASVAAGQYIEGISLALDSDAPFVLRSRAMRVKYNDFGQGARSQAYLGSLLLRLADGDRVYRSQTVVRQSLLGPYFGQLGNPIPVSPQIVYPRQGVITVDILNDGATALTNLTLYFRGVKLFSPGAVKSYEYPSNIGLLPYVYPQGTYSDTDGLTLVRNVAVTQGPLRQVFRVKGDADFVLRAGQAGVSASVQGNQSKPVNEVFVTLRDEDEKPYSNAPVHIDVLFGNSGMDKTGLMFFPFGANSEDPVACGPNSPGLFFPEIYLPKNHVMYMDVSRDDSAYAGAGADVANIPIAFIGQKVFQK